MAELSEHAPGNVYTKLEEQRQNPPGQPPVLPKVGPDISFFLLTADGRRVLAAIGNDNGNAHYGYESMPQFQEYGSRECTNRKEMTSWLEMVMHESQLQATGAVAEEIAHLGQPTDDNPEGLYYVDVKHERHKDASGRSVNSWFLVDQHGAKHLAMLGRERDARDGHYVYTAQEPFVTQFPTGHCTNQMHVQHWLEHFITHHAPESHVHVGDHIRTYKQHGRPPVRRSGDGGAAAAAPATADGGPRLSKRMRVPTAKASSAAAAGGPYLASPLQPHPGASQRGSSGDGGLRAHTPPRASTPAAHRAAGAAGASPQKLGGAAEASQQKRIRTFRAAAEGQAAWLKTEVLAELEGAAAVARGVQEDNRAAALQWAAMPPTKVDLEHISCYIPVVAHALRTHNIPIPPAAAPLIAALEREHPYWVQKPEMVALELLEALREIATTYSNAAALVDTHVVALMRACRDYPCEAVRTMAEHAIEGWRRRALVHARALIDPLMRVDPLHALSDMRTRQALEVPLPRELQRALRGEVSPQKPALAPSNSQTAAAPSGDAPGTDVGAASAAPDSAGPSGAAAPADTAGLDTTRGTNGVELEADARASASGAIEAAPSGASPSAAAAAAGVPQSATPVATAPPLASPVKPASNGHAAAPGAPGAALGARDGSGLAVGSWTTTNKRSPQKHSPGTVQRPDKTGGGGGAWGSEADAAAEVAALPQPSSATPHDVKVFVEAARARLQSMPHRAVPVVCTRLHAHCVALAEALQGRAKAEALAAVTSGTQAAVAACRQIREKAGAQQRSKHLKDVSRYLEEVDVSLQALSLEVGM